ncbi:hypothetical protein [Caudoviricetes sp.]|nr:hypothetical protein [Caudoviricetes sp.]
MSDSTLKERMQTNGLVKIIPPPKKKEKPSAPSKRK